MVKKQLEFDWTSYNSAGDVYVVINGVRYVYHIDAAHVTHFLRLYKRAKGKALTFLKEKAGDRYRKL